MVAFKIYINRLQPFKVIVDYDNIFEFAWILDKSDNVEFFKVFVDDIIYSYKDLNFAKMNKWTVIEHPRGE